MILLNWRVWAFAALMASYVMVWYKTDQACKNAIIAKSAVLNIDTRIKENEVQNLRPDAAGLAGSLRAGRF